MTCPVPGKIEAYLDNELSAHDDREITQHLATCPACAMAALGGRKLKLGIRRAASSAFAPSAEFQAKIRRSVAPRSRPSWLAGLAFAVAVLLVVVVLGLWMRPRSQNVLSEATDLHVSVLASANPVDVVSTDRHTVKPWFEGKLPFTFDLPDLQNSDFHLIGGRMSYIAQSPGAQLIFGIRKHQVSVFIFKDGENFARIGSGPKRSNDLSFDVKTWSDRGLRYIIVSDTNSADVDSLSDLLRAARQ